MFEKRLLKLLYSQTEKNSQHRKVYNVNQQAMAIMNRKDQKVGRIIVPDENENNTKIIQKFKSHLKLKTQLYKLILMSVYVSKVFYFYLIFI